ncbi:MAG: HD domain-containing phosphohydrolase [Bacteroidota bacterium]
MSENRLLQILLIEDSDDDAQLVLREIRRLGYQAQARRIETAEELRAALTAGTWDLVLCDYSLPHLNAPQALEIIKSSGQDLPFIIISGTIGEESAISALKAGAHDFIIKGKYARLGPAIERELGEAKIRRDQQEAEIVLREKERLLSEAQRIGHIGSWSLDLPSGTLQFSDEMYRLLGISVKEFDHRVDSLLHLIFSEDRPAAEGWLDQIRSGRQVRELVFRILHETGELRYVQCRGALSFNEAGQPLRFVGTAQDITERKLSELQIRQQIARLTALRMIDQAITSSFDMRFTLDIVLSQVISQLQVDAADILLLSATGQALEVQAARGFRTPLLQGTHVGITDSLAGRVATEQRSIEIMDLKDVNNQKLPASIASEGFVSYYGVPLVTKGKVEGVLELYHRVPLIPYPEWVDYLETLAGQAAIAIDNATLFESLEKSNFELEHAYDATIEGWSHALDLRDHETEGHTRRVTEMAVELARLIGLDEESLVQLRRGGLLHDVGKLGVPDHILLKPGDLTEEEWKTMRMHPQFAYDWLIQIAYLRKAIEIPYNHHEKWDGTGYPRGLKGETIPLMSRIFALADVWDALTSDRPYRPAWPPEKALQYIRENSGTHFDPALVDIFTKYITVHLADQRQHQETG